MAEISVIIPTHDRPQLVGRALASVLQQTFHDFEIVLVDNNRSTPSVSANPAVVEALRDPRVRILDATTARSAAAVRNVGLGAARGNWITFLDDDDEYRPGKLAAQHLLAHQTGVPLVVCGYEFVWPTRTRRRQCDSAVFNRGQILSRAFLGSPVLFHRRDDAIRFDEDLTAGEDIPYALQLVAKHRISSLPCVPQPLVIVHPQPRGSCVHADKAAVWRAYRRTWQLARRDFPREARHAMLAQGRLERAIGGYGDLRHFLRCVASMLRSRGVREWRFAAFAILARWHRRQPGNFTR